MLPLQGENAGGRRNACRALHFAGRFDPLNRTYSLKRHKEFRYTYRAGKAVSCRLFTLVYVQNRRHALRIGFSVSKKVGNSVCRNRAKRRLRACVTPMLGSLKAGWNLIFIAREEVLTCPFTQMQSEMQRLLERANVWVHGT